MSTRARSDLPADPRQRLTPVAALPEEQEAVAQLRVLIEGAAGRGGRRLSLIGAGSEWRVLPESLVRVLERAAELLARGDAVSLVPVAQELTTQQAADLLGVSRQYLVRMLEAGELPFSKTGTHRRLRLADVLALKESRAAKRAQQLDELAQRSEQAGGYPELD